MLARKPLHWLPSFWHLAAVAIVSGLAALIGIVLTREAGEIAAGAGVATTQPLEFLPVYIAIACTAVYAIGVIIARRRRLNQTLLDRNVRLADSESLYRLLADNASDIITRVRMGGQRLYVSPSCRDVLGWTVEQMLRADWENNVHPDDWAIFTGIRAKLQAGAMRSSGIYRYRRSDGSWAWIEARAHAVREPDGSASEFIGNMRDVTRQKEAELALEAAMAKLSQQAKTDALTGIANRRRFDETLPREWRRAMRVGEPLSLLLIDVDHFKAFNDRHGHQGGDECLRLIAETMAAVIRRPHDLVARYGGEEFVAVLPATTLDGAERIAEALRAAVAAMVIPQLASSENFITVSIGVASAVPTGDSAPAALVAAADGALYAAKRQGRNCVAVADRADVVRFRAIA